jgi:hypothetical protein
MDRSEASALADLQMHWDEAYVITLDGHIWSARYRTSAEELRAHTSAELRELIRSDYAYRQKADLIAYDPDEVYDDSEDSDDAATDDDGPAGDEVEAGGGETGASGDQEQREEAPAPEREEVEAGSFATIRGERMSI